MFAAMRSLAGVGEVQVVEVRLQLAALQCDLDLETSPGFAEVSLGSSATFDFTYTSICTPPAITTYSIACTPLWLADSSNTGISAATQHIAKRSSEI
jgi:hypothetical protein